MNAPSLQIAPPSARYRRFALGLLLVIYIFNFLDRQIVNILAEPIKRELALADWQLGVMTGLAFAVFYTVLGLPIARYAERGDRPAIIASAVLVWSLFSALCGFAQTFVQLLAARIGVGIGEAGCSPPAHSLLSDYTPPEKRASALAIYAMGTPLGGLIGMAVGGLVADQLGWRAAFLLTGAPGVLLAVLALTTLKEPRRRLSADMKTQAAGGASFRTALQELLSKRSFWGMAFGASIIAFVGYGHGAFNASFFLRAHGEALGEIASQVGLKPMGLLGLALGLGGGLGGALGAWVGGYLADRAAAKGNLQAYATIPALGALLGAPVYVLAMLTPDPLIALALLAVPAFFNGFWYGPVYASAQSVVAPRTRATAAAVLLLIINLVGLGLGPVGVGLLSDGLAASGLGEAEGVRWAQILSTGTILIAVGCFLSARRTIVRDMVA